MPHTDPEKERERKRIYREKNKEKLKAASKDYYERNKDSSKARASKWQKDNKQRAMKNQLRSLQKRLGLEVAPAEVVEPKPITDEEKAAFAERAKQKANASYARNKEAALERQKKWREANPERYKAIHRKWKQANKDKINSATHRKRAMHQKMKLNHSTAEWQALKAKYDFRCLWCTDREPDVKLARDHIMPITMGGTNLIDNIQPLCKSCNSKKGTANLDFRPERDQKA